MKFEFKKRSLENRSENMEWKNILLRRRLLAAAESSSSAASGRGVKPYDETVGDSYSARGTVSQ